MFRSLCCCIVGVSLAGCNVLSTEKLAQVVDVKKIVGETIFASDPINSVKLACEKKPSSSGTEASFFNNTSLSQRVSRAPISVTNLNSTPIDISKEPAYQSASGILSLANYNAKLAPDVRTETGLEFGFTQESVGKAFSEIDFDFAGKKQVVSASQIINFVKKVLNSSILSSSTDAVSDISASTNDPWEVFKRYFAFYASEGFVSRDGTKYERFALKTQTGSEEISVLVRIFLEALIDARLKTEIFIKDEKTPLVGSELPTAIRAEVIVGTKLLPTNESKYCGITKAEFDVISRSIAFDSDVAGLISKTLLEVFGNFEISIVIGAEIKFGDSETVSAATQTFAEVLTRAAREKAMIKFFEHFSYDRIPIDAESGLECSFCQNSKTRILSNQYTMLDRPLSSGDAQTSSGGLESGGFGSNDPKRIVNRSPSEHTFFKKMLFEIDRADKLSSLNER